MRNAGGIVRADFSGDAGDGQLPQHECVRAAVLDGCIWVVARILRTGDSRLWIWFGVLAGLGLENKHSTLSFGFAVTVALLLTQHRRSLRGRGSGLRARFGGVVFAQRGVANPASLSDD